MPVDSTVCTLLTLLTGLSVWCCVTRDVDSVLHDGRSHAQAKVFHTPFSELSADKLPDDRPVSDILRHVEQLLLTQSLQLRQYERRLHDQEELIQQQSLLLSQHELRIAVLEGKNQAKDPRASVINDPNQGYDPAVGSISKIHDSAEDKLGKTVIHGEELTNKTRSIIESGHPIGSHTVDLPHRDRRVQERADDNGPLEAVVNQLTQQVTAMTADLQTLKASSQQQVLDVQDARASAFVRWGSSSCPGTSQLVYSGVVGGSLYTDPGAATNYLCLTLSPNLGRASDGGAGASLHGGEYHGGYSNNPDAVCAVCRSSFATTVMIPGTDVCTSGWHLQYSGYLMAGRRDHAAGSEYICVDAGLETLPHTETAQNGNLLYFTATSCSTLPCSPYVDDRIVTCAVCSG